MHAASVAPPAPPLAWQYWKAVTPFTRCGLSLSSIAEPRPRVGPSVRPYSAQFLAVSRDLVCLQIALRLFLLTFLQLLRSALTAMAATCLQVAVAKPSSAHSAMAVPATPIFLHTCCTALVSLAAALHTASAEFFGPPWALQNAVAAWMSRSRPHFSSNARFTCVHMLPCEVEAQ